MRGFRGLLSGVLAFVAIAALLFGVVDAYAGLGLSESEGEARLLPETQLQHARAALKAFLVSAVAGILAFFGALGRARPAPAAETERESREEVPEPPRRPVEAIAADLEAAEPRTRGRALEELAERGPAAAGALDRVLDVLGDDAQPIELRSAAAVAAARIGADVEAFLPPVLLLLSEESFLVRERAVVTLYRIGPPAVSAVPSLAPLAGDRELGAAVRRALREILGEEEAAALIGARR